MEKLYENIVSIIMSYYTRFKFVGKVMHILFVTQEYCPAMEKKSGNVEFEFWNTLTEFRGGV